MAFASLEYEEIFIFEDLLLAPSPANFQQYLQVLWILIGNVSATWQNGFAFSVLR